MARSWGSCSISAAQHAEPSIEHGRPCPRPKHLPACPASDWRTRVPFTRSLTSEGTFTRRQYRFPAQDGFGIARPMMYHLYVPVEADQVLKYQYISKIKRLGWWVMRDSNSRHLRCKRSALPTELITRAARDSQAVPPAQEALRNRTQISAGLINTGPTREPVGSRRREI